MSETRHLPLSEVTAETVARALSELPLSFANGWDMELLAANIRRGLSVFEHQTSNESERVGNADAQKEMTRLANLAAELLKASQSLSSTALNAVWQRALKEDNFNRDDPDSNLDPPSFRRFGQVNDELAWLAWFFRNAASDIETRTTRWRQRSLRDQRIRRGYVLGAIYQAAFNEEPTVNDFTGELGGGSAQAQTHFMRFYKCMVALVFGEQATNDLPGVLRQSVNLLKAHPPGWPSIPIVQRDR